MDLHYFAAKFIQRKPIDLIEWSIEKEDLLFLASNERNAILLLNTKLWSCQNMCEGFTYLLDNIFIRFGTKLYIQIDGISMGTNCAPLIHVADLLKKNL